MKESNVAMLFAMEKHKDQVRKYTSAPYASHLAEVAGIVAAVLGDDISVATAWLHDCMEDQCVTLSELLTTFHPSIAEGVLALSDLETGNRKQRKTLSRERLAKAPAWVQTIKVADLISNTSSIVKFDHDFAKVYLEEKRLLLEVLTLADPVLLHIAKRTIDAP